MIGFALIAAGIFLGAIAILMASEDLDNWSNRV